MRFKARCVHEQVRGLFILFIIIIITLGAHLFTVSPASAQSNIISTRFNQHTRPYEYIANFTLDERDEYGQVQTYQINTIQFNFDGPSGGIVLPQVMHTDHGDLLMELRVEPVLYPLITRDTAYAIPAESMVMQQNVIETSLTSHSAIPPSSMLIDADAQDDSVTDGSASINSRRLLTSDTDQWDESSDQSAHDMGTHAEHIYWDGQKHYGHTRRHARPAPHALLDDHFEHLESLANNNSSDTGASRALLQAAEDTWDRQPRITTVANDIITRLLKRIDKAYVDLGQSGWANNFDNWQSGQISRIRTCAYQSVMGISDDRPVKEKEQNLKYFGFGVPCLSTALPADNFGNNPLGLIIRDQTQMACLGHAYAKFLEHRVQYGMDCRQGGPWPDHIMPDRALWCDYTPQNPHVNNLNKWITNMITFMSEHPQQRVLLSLTQPSCSTLEHTYDSSKPNAPLQIRPEQRGKGPFDDPMYCTIDRTRPTKTSFSQNQVFNQLKHGNYEYYDSDECPCMPAEHADNEYFLTCSETPWTLVPRTKTAAGVMTPQGLSYKVGILTKCVPVNKLDPLETKGFCTPFTKDVNLKDTSVSKCEKHRGTYPYQCRDHEKKMIKFFIKCNLASAACIVYAKLKGWLRCPEVDVCASSFADNHYAVETERSNLLRVSAEAMHKSMADAANITDFIAQQVIPATSSAVHGFNKITSSLFNATTMGNRIARAQLQNLKNNAPSLANLKHTQEQLSRQQEVGFGSFMSQVNSTLLVLDNLRHVDSLFVNMTEARLLFLREKESTTVDVLVKTNREIDQIYTSMHEALFTMNQQVTDTVSYRAMKDMANKALSSLRHLHNKVPLVSDYDPETDLYGQDYLDEIPTALQNMTVESYWTYSATMPAPVTNYNTILTQTGMRVHQQNFVQMCDTRSLLDYDEVTVEIEQWLKQIQPRHCWMEVRHYSCEAAETITVGTMIETILASSGYANQYPLFTFMRNDNLASFQCKTGTLVQHHNVSESALHAGAQRLDYAYQLDEWMTNFIRAVDRRLVALPNSALWPGHAVYRSGKLGALFLAAQPVSIYQNTDLFSREMAHAKNPYASLRILPLVNTLYASFANSFAVALGSATLVELSQLVDIGRLPRYGIAQRIFKVQNENNSPSGTDSRDNQIQNANRDEVTIATNTFISAQDILLDDAFTDYLQQQLEKTQTTGFNNVLQMHIAAVSKEAVPVHETRIDDRAKPKVTILVYRPRNGTDSSSSSSSSSSIGYEADEAEFLNSELLVNNTYTDLGTVLDQNKIVSAVSTDLFMVHYWSCLLGAGDQDGCPVVPSTSRQAESSEGIATFRYVYDLDNEDLTPYARTLLQGENRVDYGKTPLGVQLVERLMNETRLFQSLQIADFRNTTLAAQLSAQVPDWGRSVLYYLNRTGITLEQMVQTETDIEQILHAAAYDQDIEVTRFNEDVLQHLVSWHPSFYGISLRNYMVGVSCRTYIFAAPFDQYKYWDCECLKPLASRQALCRRLDLFYIAAPVSWIQHEPNPDFWNKLYLRPKNSTTQVTVRLHQAVATRVLKRSSINPCPDESQIRIQQSAKVTDSALFFPRPMFRAEPVHLQILMQIGSVHETVHVIDSNSTAPAQPEADCVFFVENPSQDNSSSSSSSSFSSSYNSQTQQWSIVHNFTFDSHVRAGDNTLVRVQLPSGQCRLRALQIERVNHVEGDAVTSRRCFDFAASTTPPANINAGVAVIHDELPVRTSVTAMAFAQMLSSVTRNLALINTRVMGQIDIYSTTSFPNSRDIIKTLLNPAAAAALNTSALNLTLLASQGGTYNASALAPLGHYLVPSGNDTATSNGAPRSTIVNSDGFTPESILAILNGTDQISNFASRFDKSWTNATNDLNIVAKDLGDSMFDALSQGDSLGAGMSFRDVDEIIRMFQNSVVLYDDNYLRLQNELNLKNRQYNLSSNILAASSGLLAALKSTGVQCLALMARLKTEYPERLLELEDNLKNIERIRRLQDGDDIRVTANPFSWLNFIKDRTECAYAWWLLLSVTSLLLVLSCILIGRYYRNDVPDSGLRFFCYNLYQQLFGESRRSKMKRVRDTNKTIGKITNSAGKAKRPTSIDPDLVSSVANSIDSDAIEHFVHNHNSYLPSVEEQLIENRLRKRYAP